jgi:hypothetical protein
VQSLQSVIAEDPAAEEVYMGQGMGREVFMGQ